MRQQLVTSVAFLNLRLGPSECFLPYHLFLNLKAPLDGSFVAQNIPKCTRAQLGSALDSFRRPECLSPSPQTETQHPILIRTIFQNKVFSCSTAATGQSSPPIQGILYTFAMSSTGFFWAPLNHKLDHPALHHLITACRIIAWRHLLHRS